MTTEKDRAEFEKWYAEGVSWSDGTHKAAWLAWQARARSGAVPAGYQVRTMKLSGADRFGPWRECGRAEYEVARDSGTFVDDSGIVWPAESRVVFAAAPEPPQGDESNSTDDPHEFGAGIVQTPGARYWRERSAEWMARAVMLGWREHRDACQEAGVDPDAAPVSAPADARDAEDARRYRWLRNANIANITQFFDAVGDATNIQSLGWKTFDCLDSAIDGAMQKEKLE